MRSVKTENSEQPFWHPDDPDNEDRALWVYYVGIEGEEHLPPSKRTIVMASVWVPTLEEREAIAAGANIRLLLWARRPPPVTLDLTVEKIEGPNL